ncbi:MAG: helix-turn-helix domain-containing protein [Leptospira sp.]|nr:helix-turn-helix domain-containing protein [Leptospira sp.]
MKDDLAIRLMKARRYIEDHYSEALLLSDVAKSSHLSAFHFHRLFKTYFGQTCIDYLNLVRLEKSIQLLLMTNVSVADISFEIGFENPETFIRNFKKKFQLTPQAYRKAKESIPFPGSSLGTPIQSKIIKNPFQKSRYRDLENVCMIRHSGSSGSYRRTMQILLDKSLQVGLFREPFLIYGRSIDPPKLEDTSLRRIEFGVPIPKHFKKEIPFPLEEVKFRKGTYLSLFHKDSIRKIEVTYQLAYHYLLQNPNIPLSDEPAWEIYHKIPPFYRSTEIEILFHLKD